MPVSVDLLDSMLTPEKVTLAESCYHSIPLEFRVRELMSLIVLMMNTSSTENSDNPQINSSRTMLATVLLRREICALAGSESTTGMESSASVILMREVAELLMRLFEAGKGGDLRYRQIWKMIGHCIADLCMSLSVVSKENGIECMRNVLNRLKSGVVANDSMYLRLLFNIAESSPVTLWTVGNLETFSYLFRNICDKIQFSTLEQLEASLGALCQIGIAYEKVKLVTLEDNTNSSSSEIEKMVLLQFPEKVKEIDPSSPPAILGNNFLPVMLNFIVSFTSSASFDIDIDVLISCMSHLSTCSEQCPSVVAGSELTLTALLQACMSIAQSYWQKDDDMSFLKLSALDVIATMCSLPQLKQLIIQQNTVSPKSISDLNQTSSLLRFLIQGNSLEGNVSQKGVLYLCTELSVAGIDDDEESWANEHTSVYDIESLDESDHVALHAESLLESFVQHLGGASSLPFIFQLVDILMGIEKWQNQRTALSILERCLVAAPVAFAPHIPTSIEAALQLAQSSNHRVQYEALHFVSALCCTNTVIEGSSKSIGILVRENYADKIIPCICHLVLSPCIKVASKACLTIMSYCQDDNQSPVNNIPIAPFIGILMDALISGPLSIDLSQPASITCGSITLLNLAVDSVACLAHASGEVFHHYYRILGHLMSIALVGVERSEEGIQLIVNTKNSNELKHLRGSGLEAATIVVAAVCGVELENVETYAHDTSEIMNIAATFLNATSDIIPYDQVLAACARIACVMRAEFAPYMPQVLPQILNKAIESDDVFVTDEDCSVHQRDDTGCNASDGYSVLIPGIGTKRVSINTVQLEEKALAARALYEIARSLGHNFDWQYVEPSFNAFLPLVNCKYSGEVRSTSSLALSQVFKAACLSASNIEMNIYKKTVCESMFLRLSKLFMKQLGEESEEDIECRNAMADALSEVMYDSFTQECVEGDRITQISEADAKEIVPKLMYLIQECFQRRSNLVDMKYVFLDDDEAFRCKEKLQGEENLLTHLVDSVGYVLKSLGEKFIDLFKDNIASTMGKLLTASGTRDLRARVASICLFDDCIEFCGPQAEVYAPLLLQGVCEGLESNDEDLQTASAYGVLQLVLHGPTYVKQELSHELLIRASSLLEPDEKCHLAAYLATTINL